MVVGQIVGRCVIVVIVVPVVVEQQFAFAALKSKSECGLLENAREYWKRNFAPEYQGPYFGRVCGGVLLRREEHIVGAEMLAVVLRVVVPVLEPVSHQHPGRVVI